MSFNALVQMLQTYMYMHILHTYTHIHIYIHKHTYIHIYTFTCALVQANFLVGIILINMTWWPLGVINLEMKESLQELNDCNLT
jgi:hypothetical protein